MHQVNTSNTVSSSTIELTNKLNTGHFARSHVQMENQNELGYSSSLGGFGPSPTFLGNRFIVKTMQLSQEGFPVSNHNGNNINKYES